MRTTILIDDRLGELAREHAGARGLSFSALVARALQELLARPEGDAGEPTVAAFRLVKAGSRGPRAGVDLDRASQMVIDSDDTEMRGASGDPEPDATNDSALGHGHPHQPERE